MKRALVVYLVIVFFLGVFSLDLVSSQSSSCGVSNNNQLIFKISSVRNAHAQVWNAQIPIYTEEICFNDFFAAEYDPGASDPHAANTASNNKVIKLSAQTNAHLEDPNMASGGFLNPVTVYYGDLRCEVKPLAEGCAGIIVNGHRAVRIGSLSGTTNAHFLRSEVNNDYPYWLCCASASTDPNPNTIDCGNGVVDPGEDCDPEDPNTAIVSCPSPLSGNAICIAAGELNECTYDTTGCSANAGPFCTTFALNSQNRFSIFIGGIETIPNSCANFNEIQEGDINLAEARSGTLYPGSSPSGRLNEFKRDMCNQCNTLIPDRQLCAAARNPSNCYNPTCLWDGVTLECNLDHETLEGGVCTVRVVSSSGTCDAGETFKTVEYEVTGPSTCNPGTYTRDVPCPRVVQLPFFNSLNFVISLIAIAIIYFVIYFNTRKKKRK